MMNFLRRHQKYFFLVITIVIVISFSFFGTYSVFVKTEKGEAVAFTAVDGTKIYQTQLNDLVRLLSYDSRDALLRNGGGTAFNDGFIAKDILATGVGEILAKPFLAEFREELSLRADKEKRFTPYVHPHAPFISAEQVWTYFVPDMKKHYDAMKGSPDAATTEAFHERCQLFLFERQFPQPYLKQIIRYQEGQNSWLAPDEELPGRDLALFGYHSLNDWFGKKFIDLVAQYVINVAIIAEQKGYQISTDEVLALLSQNVAASFRENQRNPYFAYTNIDHYFAEELRRQGMDQARLVRAWRSVALYRRYFGENKNAILISTLPYKDFYRHQNEYATVEVYRLPRQATFSSPRDLAKFEVYLNAVRDSKEKGFGIPEKILSPKEVQKNFPELVQKWYRVRWCEVDKEMLATKIGVKNTWEWQGKEESWKKLAEKYPELAAKKAKNEQERLAILESLDPKTRSQIDSASRELIIQEHPEWIEIALEKEPTKEEDIYLRQRGGHLPFHGIQNHLELERLLDSVEIGASNPALASYSQDSHHYVRIQVQDRKDGLELLTLRQALDDGTLDNLLDTMCEGSYAQLRSSKPKGYLKENGEWKPYSEVREAVCEHYFADLFQRIGSQSDKIRKAHPELCNWDNKDEARAAARLFAYVESAREQVLSGKEALCVIDKKMEASDPLHDQFKLIRTQERIVRKDKAPTVSPGQAFSLPPGEFSGVGFAKSGLSFYRVLERGVLSDEGIREKVYEARALLGNEVVRAAAENLITTIQDKKGFSLLAQ